MIEHSSWRDVVDVLYGTTSAPTANKYCTVFPKYLTVNTGSKSKRTQWILIQREQTNQLRKAGTMGELHPYCPSAVNTHSHEITWLDSKSCADRNLRAFHTRTADLTDVLTTAWNKKYNLPSPPWHTAEPTPTAELHGLRHIYANILSPDSQQHAPLPYTITSSQLPLQSSATIR